MGRSAEDLHQQLSAQPNKTLDRLAWQIVATTRGLVLGLDTLHCKQYSTSTRMNEEVHKILCKRNYLIEASAIIVLLEISCCTSDVY